MYLHLAPCVRITLAHFGRGHLIGVRLKERRRHHRAKPAVPWRINSCIKFGNIVGWLELDNTCVHELRSSYFNGMSSETFVWWRERCLFQASLSHHVLRCTRPGIVSVATRALPTSASTERLAIIPAAAGSNHRTVMASASAESKVALKLFLMFNQLAQLLSSPIVPLFRQS